MEMSSRPLYVLGIYFCDQRWSQNLPNKSFANINEFTVLNPPIYTENFEPPPIGQLHLVFRLLIFKFPHVVIVDLNFYHVNFFKLKFFKISKQLSCRAPHG